MTTSLVADIEPRRPGQDPAPAVAAVDDDALIAPVLALAGRRVLVLSGAGLSTESGIPDYRGPATRAARARHASGETASPPSTDAAADPTPATTSDRARKPMRFAQFVGDPLWRRRYWARATLGWPRIRDAVENAGHRAIAALAHRGVVSGVITQNVDGLHHRAGCAAVELHGALREVVCLGCGVVSDRDALQARLLAGNPGFVRAVDSHNPDGDVDLDDDAIASFVAVDCDGCGGALKPRVVFFGENVAPETLQGAWQAFDAADALLVVGTSLEVFSGRRFVEEAARRRRPIVIVNVGTTRCDALATVVVDGACGDVLPRLARAL